ncbi:MAG: CTP synthase [Puniceicoccales bacterium]|jgi:CTP synthase|nr:CTP synthase [Puniceicoccales bacterium]
MKYVFITGGVVSSLGKGLTAGAVAALLECHGYRVKLQKFDPYLNVDPGTMSPFQHGEVYVLNDGTETDLDLGHYERFTAAKLSKENSVSAGQIYASIIEKERRGDFLGKTVQIIPHVTDEIKEKFQRGANDCDILLTEIGGTVGDMESLPFIEAMRQMAMDVGKENVLYLHMALVPYLRAAEELKTKPCQQSVAKLREIGIQPDVLICRTEIHLSQEIRDKISMFCNVEKHCVIEELDLQLSIYELPVVLHRENLDKIILERLQLPTQNCDISKWEKIVEKLAHPRATAKIGLVGKYTSLKDAYKSVFEALTHAGIANDCKVETIPIDAEDLEKCGTDSLSKVDGILIPGGFGDRGTEGKIAAARYARENDIPYFGICLGMQIAVIEFARNVAGIADATSEEFDENARNKIIFLMHNQENIKNKGATMRLGLYDCALKDGTKTQKIYGVKTIAERHRHRYEFNPQFEKIFDENGMKISGQNPESGLVEIVEIPSHKWFIAVQFHPEFLSKPAAAHPLFANFIKAALKNNKFAY